MNATVVRRTLIAYDIPDDNRRTRIANATSEFGDRVQYSVFVVDATPAALNRLIRTLEGLMDRGADSILVCDLGAVETVTTRFRYLGQQRPITDATDFVV